MIFDLNVIFGISKFFGLAGVPMIIVGTQVQLYDTVWENIKIMLTGKTLISHDISGWSCLPQTPLFVPQRDTLNCAWATCTSQTSVYKFDLLKTWQPQLALFTLADWSDWSLHHYWRAACLRVHLSVFLLSRYHRFQIRNYWHHIFCCGFLIQHMPKK